ncbi:large ribosomal subunit protein bL33m isoform X2 [Poecile atricapillus]|uniref:large ribosomal subunit protein bL33m isoform X2 n=1 Tax=Poecile atricapillus TaxID=48891 RepID=UPI00273A3EB5|nr:large ribosomal subunit protein bL33m isoform X2 [Poecile atricapillus]
MLQSLNNLLSSTRYCPTASCLSCTEEPRTGHGTPYVASGGAGPLPSTCWPQAVLDAAQDITGAPGRQKGIRDCGRRREHRPRAVRPCRPDPAPRTRLWRRKGRGGCGPGAMFLTAAARTFW